VVRRNKGLHTKHELAVARALPREACLAVLVRLELNS
jgi:hypothetical protein